jgi:crotonobetainyl-CoA:carnitine CoA-transferase CaiB-like acyl-CoA transferase
MHAAANVTTEGATYNWLVGKRVLQRLTGRHASVAPTAELQVEAADGRYVSSGPPPRKAEHFQAVLDWMAELEIVDDFPDALFLRLGVERGGVDQRDVAGDVELMEIYRAGREALSFISSRIGAKEYFLGAQARDLQCGVIYSPEEALEDAHFRARGFPVTVRHPELERDVVYPGAPFKVSGDHGWAIQRRPPLVGEHNHELLK